MTERARPEVSVIVIFKDEEAFLEQAIESVFVQTLPSWEMLLVDDGSTDGSTAIARHFAQQADGQVRYLEHRGHANLGMSAARNLGLSQAAGEFVSLLDADDELFPHALEEAERCAYPVILKSTAGGGGRTLEDCVKFWDRDTHMTKSEWQTACQRSQQRLDNLKIESLNIGLDKNKR